MGNDVRSYKDLFVFQRSLDLAVSIFERTRAFPQEERFSLTDQVRRSTRSVCANIGEARRKRRYEAAFISKMNDAEAEACETQVWIEIARRCNYLTGTEACHLDDECDHIIAQLVKMIDESHKWTFGKS